MWSLFHISKYWGASLLSSTGESVQFQNPKLNPTQYMGANGPFFIRFFIDFLRIIQVCLQFSHFCSMWRTTYSLLGWMGRVVSWEPFVRCTSRPSLDTALSASSLRSSSRKSHTQLLILNILSKCNTDILKAESIFLPEENVRVHRSRAGRQEGGGLLQVWKGLHQVRHQIAKLPCHHNWTPF